MRTSSLLLFNHYLLMIQSSQCFLPLAPTSRYIQRKQRFSLLMSGSNLEMNTDPLNEDDVNNINSKNGYNIKSSPPIYTKMHSMTICMVPSPKCKDVWQQITKARTELRDPGLYRWPPHANILYPFFDILAPKLSNDNMMERDDIINEKLISLQSAIQKCKAFRVSIDSLGTFGGNNRGVLYLVPHSYRDQSSCSQQNNLQFDEQPLLQLQSLLQNSFPECNDQRKNGKYTPHITLAHFPSLESALEAKEIIEKWWTIIEFEVNEVYLLKREGDGGQFKIVATLKLGDMVKTISNNDQTTKNIEIHNPPIAFSDMPQVEEEWVYNERMKLKERRNGEGNGRNRGTKTRQKKIDRGPSNSTDTSEIIARKRAERAAKKERLRQEIELIEQAIGLSADDRLDEND